MTDAARPHRPGRVQRAFLRAPVHLYRAGLGPLLGGRFVLVRHRGRRSGLPRETVVEVVAREPDGTLTVAAGWGPGADWYRNLRTTPQARATSGRWTGDVVAVRATADQAAHALEEYTRRHPRAARRLGAFMGVRLDGTDEGLRDAAARLPMLRLVPRGNGRADGVGA